jgi:hypothetical protein
MNVHTVHVLLSAPVSITEVTEFSIGGVSCLLTPHISHFSIEALFEKKQIAQAHTLPLISKLWNDPIFFVFDCEAAS